MSQFADRSTTWYAPNQPYLLGNGSSKNAFQVGNTNLIAGFDPIKSVSVGKSPDPNDYVILSILF